MKSDPPTLKTCQQCGKCWMADLPFCPYCNILPEARISYLRQRKLKQGDIRKPNEK